MVFEFPGLDCPSGADPASARRYLAEIDENTLVDQLTELAIVLRRQVVENGPAVADMLAAPVAEVVASPFGFRACALAAHEGAALVHHELRLLRPWHESHVGDDDVIDEDHGAWGPGGLRTGKYQSFLQEDPFSTLNPGHIAKWTPHELLHRACAFMWRPGMPAWELYLGARLNELAPVALWYGPDQVLRLDDDDFDRRAPGTNPRTIADALWLTRSPDELRSHARRTAWLLQRGVAHFDAELAAVRAEFVDGRRHRVDHEFLDASSDALAYVAGHRRRLLDRSTSRVLGVIGRPGREAFDSVIDYADFVEGRFHQLLFGCVSVDERLAAGRRDARRLRDWLQRAALAGWPALRRLLPVLDEAASASRRGMRGRAPALDLWRQQITAQLDASTAQFVFSDGFDRRRPEPAGLAQLRAGFETVMPATTRSLGGDAESVVLDFVGSDTFCVRAPLALRFAEFCMNRGDVALAALARFEHEIGRERRRDDDIERLCTTDPRHDARVLGSRAFELATFAVDVVPWHAVLAAGEAGAPGPGAATYLIGRFGEGVSVVPAPPPVAALFSRLQEGPLTIDEVVDLLEPIEQIDDPSLPSGVDEWIDELLAAGVIGCTDAVQA